MPEKVQKVPSPRGLCRLTVRLLLWLSTWDWVVCFIISCSNSNATILFWLGRKPILLSHTSLAPSSLIF
jgi:hypothetical protein